jgi:hypothetical protein
MLKPARLAEAAAMEELSRVRSEVDQLKAEGAGDNQHQREAVSKDGRVLIAARCQVLLTAILVWMDDPCCPERLTAADLLAIVRDSRVRADPWRRMSIYSVQA